MGKIKSRPESSTTTGKVLTRQFVFLCLTNFLHFLTVYSLLVTLPVYAVTLGAPEGQVGFVTAAVTLTSFLALPYLGRWVDRLGRTTLLHLGPLLLLGEAIALPHVSWFPLLVATGVICGAGLASFQTGAPTLVADIAPIHRRGEAVGILGAFTTSAVALSPTIATYVMRSPAGFPGLFTMTAVLAGAAFALSFVIKEPPRRTTPAVVGSLLNPRAFLPGFCIFSITLAYGAFISFLPGQAPRIGMDNAGLFFTVYAIATILVRILAGGISDRVGRIPVIIPALFIVAGATLMVGLSDSPGMILLAAAFWGLGYGSAHPTILALAVDRASPDQRSSAVTTFNVGYNLGVTVGALGMGFLLEATSFSMMAAVAGVAPVIALTALYLRRQSLVTPAPIPLPRD
ncbi:MAG: MFS transporter [Dehalococcoidia bacterium]|nr:MFS transporter [Dehalococcoidia bacterium]